MKSPDWFGAFLWAINSGPSRLYRRQASSHILNCEHSQMWELACLRWRHLGLLPYTESCIPLQLALERYRPITAIA